MRVPIVSHRDSQAYMGSEEVVDDQKGGSME